MWTRPWMLLPFALPHLVSALGKSATAMLCVNVVLVMACRLPASAPFIAAAFLGAYLCSFVVGAVGWLRRG